MNFFKEFKEDLSEAVEEMLPSEGTKENVANEDDMINTLADDVDVDGELSKLDGLLEKASSKVDSIPEEKEENGMSDYSLENTVARSLNEISPSQPTSIESSPKIPASDEHAVITPGMTISGDIDSTGSIEVEGRVNGNVRCNGKLTVTGMISGNSTASEVFADAARVDGEINASGTVKVGAGSVVIGNISASSAVIAGAVKGDIDVHGPVVVDTSAVVMGNIKSRSVQINNGAVIEGFCSQSYSDVDVNSVFN